MADVWVRCVKMAAGVTCEHIASVGDGAGKVWSVKDVVSWIDAGTHTFHTKVGGVRAEIEAVHLASPRSAFIRTVGDGTTKDNLLSLPSC